MSGREESALGRRHLGRRTAAAWLWVALGALAVVMLFGRGMAMAAEPVLAERGIVVLGGGPKYLLSDPSRHRLYVSDFERDAVVVIDLPTALVVERFPVPGSPVGLALNDDEALLFVACYGGSRVVALDLESGRIVAQAAGLQHPWDVKAVCGLGGRALLAVTENQADRVTFFDRSECAQGRMERVGSVATGYYPYQMDVAADTLFVASYGGFWGGQVQAIDLARLVTLWKTGTGKGAFDVQVSVEAGVLAVTDLSGQAVGLFDLGGKNPREVKLAADPRDVSLAQDGTVFLSLQSKDEVLALDPVEGKAAYSVRVGLRPGPMTWLPGGAAGLQDDVLAVGNQDDGTVSLLARGNPVPEFVDVPLDHPFHRYIRALAVRGAVSGYEDPGGAEGGTWFFPHVSLTRAQMAKVLVSALALHTEEIEPAATAYVDVPDDGQLFPFDYVQEATVAGIVTGLELDPPRFAPYETVTRIQALRMAVRAAAAVGSALPAAPAPAPFVDIAADSPDADLVAAAYAAGLVAGAPGGDGMLRFMPYAPVTRAQAAKIVFGLLAALHMGDVAMGDVAQ